MRVWDSLWGSFHQRQLRMYLQDGHLTDNKNIPLRPGGLWNTVSEGTDVCALPSLWFNHFNGGSDFDSYIEVIPLPLKPTRGCSSLRFWEEQTKSNACQSTDLTQSHTVRFINQKHQWKKKPKPWRRERAAFHMQPRHICPPVTC